MDFEYYLKAMLPGLLFVGFATIVGRNPLYFLLYDPVEALAEIIKVEKRADDFEYYHCEAVFDCESGQRTLDLRRNEPPPLGTKTPVVYPLRHPRHAFEGQRGDVPRLIKAYMIEMFVLVAWFPVASLVFSLFSLLGVGRAGSGE